MNGDIKITVSHVIVEKHDGDKEDKTNEKVKEKENTSQTLKALGKYSLKTFIGRVSVGTVIANSVKEANKLFFTEQATWSGNTDVGEFYSAGKTLLGFTRDISNPLKLVRDIYKYEQEIARINAEAERLATRSGNSSLSNGSRGTRD